MLGAVALKRHLLSGGTWVFAGKLITGLAQIFIAVLLARLMTPADFGVFQVLQRMLTLMALLGSFGMSWIVIRRLAEGMAANDRQAWLAVQLRCIFMIVSSIGLALAALLLIFGEAFLLSAFQIDAQSYVAVLSALVLGLSLQQLIPEVFRGLHDLRLASLFSGAATNLMMLMLFIAVLLMGQVLGVTGVLWIYLLSSLLVIVFSLAILRKRLPVFHARGYHGRTSFWGMAAENLKAGLPLTASALLGFVVRHADIWIVAAFFDIEQAAFYGAASRLVFLVAAPVMVANGATRGIIAALWAQGEKRRLERLMRTVATLTFLAGLIPGMVFVFWNEQLLSWLFGDMYQRGASVLAILVIGNLVLLAAGPAGTLMALSGHQNTALVFDVLASVLFIAFAWGLSGWLGVDGIAIAAAAAGAARPVLCMLFAYSRLGIHSHLGFMPARRKS